MPLEKLPVPEISLSTQDVGSVFQGKMNAAIEAVRTAIIAFNNQVDAALSASQQVDPAPQAEALAGTNNTYKMTPLRSMQQLQQFGLGGAPIDLADFTAAGPNIGRLFRFTNTAVGKPSFINYGSVVAIPYDGTPSTFFLGSGVRSDSSRALFVGSKIGSTATPIWVEAWDKGKSPAQASFGDPTAGSLLTARSFGIGENVGQPPQPNSIGKTMDSFDLPSGFWRVVNTDTGAKPPGLTDFAMIEWRFNSNGSTRIAAGAGGELFTFGCAGGVWNSNGWRRQYDSFNCLGSVTHDGTKNTGGLMEYGSNANGSYYKYADGRLECYINRGGIVMTADTDDAYTWTFPAAFITAPSFIKTAISGASVTHLFNVLKDSVVSQTTSTAICRTKVSASQTHTLTHVAVGRWR